MEDNLYLPKLPRDFDWGDLARSPYNWYYINGNGVSSWTYLRVLKKNSQKYTKSELKGLAEGRLEEL